MVFLWFPLDNPQLIQWFEVVCLLHHPWQPAGDCWEIYRFHSNLSMEKGDKPWEILGYLLDKPI